MNSLGKYVLTKTQKIVLLVVVFALIAGGYYAGFYLPVQRRIEAADTAELDALLPHGTAREGPGVSAVLEGADGRSLSVFAELTADGGYRVIQWQQSAEWAGEAEAPALFGTLREG